MQITTSRYASLALAIAVGTTLGACSGRRGSAAVSESAGGNVAAPAPPNSTSTGAAGGATTGAATGTDTGAATGATSGATTGAATGTDTTGGKAAGSDTSAVKSAAGGDVASLTSSFKGLSDANYAALVHEVHQGDIESGKLMETKATNPRVKAFARRMVTDHSALDKQGQQLAQRLNLTPQPPANDLVQPSVTSGMQQLQSTPKGPALDSTYMAQEVTLHKAAIGLLNTIESDASNAQLKALAKKAHPLIQSHLTEAESIQKHLQSGAKSGK